MPLSNKKQKLFIEAGARWLKWAVVAGGEPKISAIGVIPLDDRPAAAAQLSAVLKKLRPAPEEASCCLSRSLVTARNLELPSTDPLEIEKIVALQAVKQTPYTSEEIVFDYRLLDSFREGYSSLMLVIVHRDALNDYLSLSREAGLKSPQITLGTECAAAWIASAAGGPAPGETTAVLDVDAQSADFFVFRGDAVLFTQHLPLGADQLKLDPGAAAPKLIEEVSRAYQIYRSEEISKEPTALVLAGACEAVQPLKKQLSTFTELPIRDLSPTEGLQDVWDGSPEDTKRFSFSAVTGLALRKKPSDINLVPQEVIIQESLVEKSRNLFATGLLCLSIFLVFIASFAFRYVEKTSYLKWLENQAAAGKPEAASVEDKDARLREIVRVHDTSIRFFDEFQRLIRAIPPEIYMTDMSLDARERFTLQGRADSMNGALEFVNRLKSDPAFKGVESKRLTKRIADNREVVDFLIEARVAS